ncbi:MAG: amylopullulanase, partial [Neobacillus sp.]|nr:amylopullulanase [Neobacillus sp.]
MKGKSRKIISFITLFVLFAQTIALGFINPIESNAAERVVTLVGNLQDELGGSGEWNPA